MRLPAIRSLILMLALTELASGCTRDWEETEPTAARTGHEFFPLETGRFIEYDVVEILHSLTSPPVTRRSQVREVVRQAFTDAEGQPAFRLERLRRSTTAEPWQLDSVWTARLETSRAVKTAGNVPVVKLVFPVRKDLRWNGNALNGRGAEEYRIRWYDQPLAVGQQFFARTLEVVQREDSSLVSLERRVERYARGVGLVESEDTRLFYCTSTACLGQGRVDFGRQLFYRIHRHGNE